MSNDYITYDLRAKGFPIKEEWLKMTTSITAQVAARLHKPYDPNLVNKIVKVMKECDGGPYWVKYWRKIWIICDQDGRELYRYYSSESCEDCCEAMNNEFIARKIVEVL